MERRLEQLLGESCERSRFGLVYIDLDKFKEVNDRYGHQVGDLYLQEVTKRMKLQLRGGDHLARIGGDEFVALIPIERDRSDVEEIAMRLDRCFDQPFVVGGNRLDGSASLGVAICPEDGISPEELQRSADAAMYEHKQSKRQPEKLARTMQRVWNEDLRR